MRHLRALILMAVLLACASRSPPPAGVHAGSAPPDPRITAEEDRRRDALVAPHGFRYGRCVDSGRVRLDPLAETVSADERTRIAYIRLTSAWVYSLGACCTTPAAAGTSSGCVLLRVHADSSGSLDAVLVAAASLALPEGVRPSSIVLDPTPPEP